LRWVWQVRTCVLDRHRIVTGRIRRDQHLDDVVVAVVFQVHCKSLCGTGAARPVGRRLRLVSVVISGEARKIVGVPRYSAGVKSVKRNGQYMVAGP